MGSYRRRPHRFTSLLVPIGGDDPVRARNWRWLEDYYRFHLPGVEIVIGRDRRSERRRWRSRQPEAFSKATAVNDAFRRSHGDIVVVLDSDAYLPARVVSDCAWRLRHMRELGERHWFVPYHHLYRLTRPATKRLIESPPWDPFEFPTPPWPDSIDNRDGSGPMNIYAAMANILPREAFYTVGGMDERFRGWGSEDYAFARALDTLWGHRRHTHNDILHLWHPSVFSSAKGASWTVKMWEHQERPGINDQLGFRYLKADGDVDAMRALVEEHRTIGVPR